jgi:hypothetical protein
LRRETTATPALVPVRVVDAGGASADFVVRLRGGVEVTVPARFDADALRRLLGALEGASC